MIPPIQSFMPSSMLQLGNHLHQAQGRFAMDTLNSASFSPTIGQYNGVMPASAMLTTNPTMQGVDSSSPNASTGVNFKSVLASTIGQVNQTVQQPDALLKQLMSGGNVDIHDVVMANTKAELAVTLTSQVLTKMIQAYDRVSQIQV
jgi:flagellar hook-basal body complex protein FliE